VYSGLSDIPGRKVILSNKQRSIIQHKDGPLWIIAGPGSGKSEVLVLRCLKLLLVDRIDPRSIMVTTFTEKAARNLKDRLINYKTHIAEKFPDVNNIDLFQVRIGTLHSLANSIMLEYRYPHYRNYRPLDDIDQLLFIYFNCPLVKKTEKARSKKDKLTSREIKFWMEFQYIWEKDWRARYYVNNKKVPSKWIRARALESLFNRMVEDLVDINKMKKEGKRWKVLAEAYEQYSRSLEQNFRVDFAHMQRKFLDFLDNQVGKKFIEGDVSTSSPSLEYILIDEYQDTNPIQEAIYLRLCRRGSHNICIVGDDDQALYRFRGGTVQCMINFDRTIHRAFKMSIKPVALVENYRSHPSIVKWCNEFARSFDVMTKPGSRAASKPNLLAKSSIQGKYHAVGLLSAKNTKDISKNFADTVKGLLDNNIINDPSDCALLMKSTRDSRNWAGPFMDALEEKGIRAYNPRARGYLDQEEIQFALGTFLEIIDTNPNDNIVSRQMLDTCNQWRRVYHDKSVAFSKLREYVDNSKREIQKLEPKQKLKSSMQDILYHILNHEPFATWLEDPERTVRLGELTRLFEAFSSSPIPGSPGLLRGELRGSGHKKGEISWAWQQTFYNSFVTLIIDEGLNDPEDEDLIYPKGYLPIMTVHQAKGLEFPFVFVAALSSKFEPRVEHTLEEEMSKFRTGPVQRLQSPQQRAKQDVIRFYFVAYSRARYALIILARQEDVNSKVMIDNIAFGGKDRVWLDKLVGKLVQ
jgi:DNA helicase II / ATP-dependent DNA helicase PcrA